MADLLKKLFLPVHVRCWFEKRIGQKRPGNSSSSVLVRHRNRSGVVEIFGREPSMFAKVENGVTKTCQNFRRKNRKTQFWILAWFFPLFEQDRLLCARVDIGVTESPTKTAKKEEKTFLGLWDFFQKLKWPAHPVFSAGNFHFFGRGKTNFFGGGKTSKLASQWPSWGIYKHVPPVFWRKRCLLYWEKGGQIKSFSWGGQLQLVPKHSYF